MKVFGDLEHQLIELCRQIPPDFEAIKAKIEEGADVNANDGDQYCKSSLLIDVIGGYGCGHTGELYEKQCSCQYLPAVIRILLDAGFDVQLDEGRYGASALGDLIFCYPDKYILEAATVLLNAGADPTVCPDKGDPETALETIRFEAYYLEPDDEDNAKLLHELADLIESYMEQGAGKGSI